MEQQSKTGGPGAKQPLSFDTAVIDGLIDLFRCDNNAQVKELIRVYMQSSAVYIAGIEKNLAEADFGNLRKNVHTLKSSSAYVGCMKLSSLCAQAQENIRTGQNETAAVLASEILDEYRISLDLLSGYAI